jgi:hypothetical protein
VAADSILIFLGETYGIKRRKITYDVAGFVNPLNLHLYSIPLIYIFLICVIRAGLTICQY